MSMHGYLHKACFHCGGGRDLLAELVGECRCVEMYLQVREVVSTHVFPVPFTEAFETMLVLACTDARTSTCRFHLAGVVKCVQCVGMLRMRSQG